MADIDYQDFVDEYCSENELNEDELTDLDKKAIRLILIKELLKRKTSKGSVSIINTFKKD